MDRKNNFSAFMSWWYGSSLRRLLAYLAKIFVYIYDFFSVEISLRTLFWVWRRDQLATTSLSLSEMFQVWTLNFASRLVGFAVKMFTLLCYVVVTVAFGIISLAIISISIILPILLIWPYLFGWQSRGLCQYLKSRNMTLVVVKSKVDAGENIDLTGFFSLELTDATKRLFSSKSKILAKDLLAVVLKSEDVVFILIRLGLGAEMVASAFAGETIEMTKLLAKALELAIETDHQNIEAADILLSFFSQDSGLKILLRDRKISFDDLANIAKWYKRIRSDYEKEKSFLNPDNIHLSGGIGRDWAFGYTTFLKMFGRDLTDSIRNHGSSLELIGREKEIGEIERIIDSHNDGNVVLVGAPGIGKYSTLLGFAQKLVQGKAIERLSYYHIFEIDLNEVFANPDANYSPTQIIKTMLDEAVFAGNIILYIADITNLFTSEENGQENMIETLTPFLSNPDLHIIGTCDVSEYNNYIQPNSLLTGKFQRVTIKEPADFDLTLILENIAGLFENQSNCLISFEAIKESISASKKYIANLPNPEKSISLLDATIKKATLERGQTIISGADILNFVAEKYELPIQMAGESEKTKLLNLDKIMHESVIGQAEAISALSEAMQRARAQVSDSAKPIGSFLFLGPTGVGKTSTAKALARAYFGGENQMIRFDMSEYQNPGDIYRLIGDKSGRNIEQGNLVTIVREKPFSVILFDEIEKADPEILNIFLQILDEGFLTDVNDQKVSFANSIIIATSNAGADLIRESISNSEDYANIKKTLTDYLIDGGIFKPELLNRFTGVIAFAPLSQAEIGEVAMMMIEKLKKRILENQQIELEITPSVIAQLATLGFDPKMGARPMERVITDKIENLIAKKILGNEVAAGSKLVIEKM